jgi:hypothetical protein
MLVPVIAEVLAVPGHLVVCRSDAAFETANKAAAPLTGAGGPVPARHGGGRASCPARAVSEGCRGWSLSAGPAAWSRRPLDVTAGG